MTLIRAQNTIMPTNINCITLIITLESTEKKEKWKKRQQNSLISHTIVVGRGGVQWAEIHLSPQIPLVKPENVP